MMQRNTELEQFGYIVSHNLRAPITNIIGATNVLKDMDLTDEEHGILNKGINESVMKLDEVIKDLNRILQVKNEVNATKENVNFTDLTEDIKISIANLILLENINVKCDFTEVNEIFSFKPFLYSIFYNLIVNSIKYRRQHIETTIEITSRKVGNKIELTFSDNGMGIDLEKRGNEVFGLYKRFHPGTEGKGMGLFMVKTQVEALGGKISITSIVNQGTEFLLEFNG